MPFRHEIQMKQDGKVIKKGKLRTTKNGGGQQDQFCWTVAGPKKTRLHSDSELETGFCNAVC